MRTLDLAKYLLVIITTCAVGVGCSSDEESAEEAVAKEAAEKEAAATAAKQAADTAAEAAAAAAAKEQEEKDMQAMMAAQKPPEPPKAPEPVVAPPPPPAPALLPTEPFPAGYNVGNYLFVKTNGANVRSSPDTSSPVVRGLRNGERVKVYERSGKWIRIGSNEWVSQKTLSAFNKTFKIRDNEVVIRQAPNSGGRIVGKLQKGTSVQVQEVVGEWVKIGPSRYVGRMGVEQVK